MTESTDIETPTITGGPSSGNVNNTHGSTTQSRTNTSAPTASKYKGNNKHGGKGNNNKNNANTVPSVTDSFKGMTSSIKIFLSLPGEKIASSKLIDGFRKEFLTYIAANMENGADIVPIFRDGEDPIEILEKKRLPILKILDPINSSATIKEKEENAAKEKSYESIYEREINLFTKRQWEIVNKVNRAMKLPVHTGTPTNREIRT